MPMIDIGAAFPQRPAQPQIFQGGVMAPVAGAGPIPQIWQGGVQTNDLSLADTGGAVPAGYRRGIMADGGPSFLQQILPGERTANGQDAMRQGLTMAEIQQANPGASPENLFRMRAQMQQAAGNAAAQNFAIRNESANRGTGVMSNADAASTHRNESDRIRANADAFRTTPAGLQAGATIAGIQALFANPNTTLRNAGDVTRVVRQAQDLLGGRPTNTVNPTTGEAGANVGTSYQDHASDLDALRAGLPANENTLGSFLSRLNRDNSALVQRNPAAIRAYLQDRFGRAAYDEAARGGVVDSPIFGPRRGSSGVWDSLLTPFRIARQVAGGGSEWTPELEGRSLVQALERMNGSAGARAR